MDISLSTTIFSKTDAYSIPLPRALEMVRDAGIRYIEISRKHDRPAEYKPVLESLGLKVWAVHGTLGKYAISQSQSERVQAVEHEFKCMQHAAVYAPCPYVIHYLNRFNDPGTASRWRDSIERLLKKAESFSLTLAIETVPYKPETDERYAGTKEVADFVRSFNSPYCTVCLDINHSNLHEDITQAAKNCSGLISNIHVSDNHEEREEHLVPGQGMINFKDALQAVTEAGYPGPLNLECHSEEEPTVEMLEKLRKWGEEVTSTLSH